MSATSTPKRKRNEPVKEPNGKYPKFPKQVTFRLNLHRMTPEWSTYPTPAKGTIPPYPRNIPRTGKHIGPTVSVHQNRSNRNAASAAARNMRPHIAHSVAQDIKRFVSLASIAYPYYIEIYNTTKGEYKDRVMFYRSMQKAEQDLLDMYPSNVPAVLYFGETLINSTIIDNAFMSMIEDYENHIKSTQNGGRRTHKRKQKKH